MDRTWMSLFTMNSGLDTGNQGLETSLWRTYCRRLQAP